MAKSLAQRSGYGPTPAQMRDRIHGLEQAIERQKAAAPPGSGLARTGNADTIAALNHARHVLREMER